MLSCFPASFAASASCCFGILKGSQAGLVTPQVKRTMPNRMPSWLDGSQTKIVDMSGIYSSYVANHFHVITYEDKFDNCMLVVGYLLGCSCTSSVILACAFCPCPPWCQAPKGWEDFYARYGGGMLTRLGSFKEAGSAVRHEMGWQIERLLAPAAENYQKSGVDVFKTWLLFCSVILLGQQTNNVFRVQDSQVRRS